MTEGKRKPRVYLAIILPMLLGGGFVVIGGLLHLFATLRGISTNAIPDRNGMLIALPAFLAWGPIALVLSNVVLRVVPPLYRIAEGYRLASPRTPDFGTSQRQLGRIATGMALVTVPLIALGFWI
jgi:hypothetical protein